jgi:hypothetical protein
VRGVVRRALFLAQTLHLGHELLVFPEFEPGADQEAPRVEQQPVQALGMLVKSRQRGQIGEWRAMPQRDGCTAGSRT